MKLKLEIIITFTITIMLLNPIATVWADEADDDENENIINEINIEQENIIESANPENKKPVLNSKRYTIFDRKSDQAIYGKDETKQTAMASTTKIMTRNSCTRKLQKFR